MAGHGEDLLVARVRETGEALLDGGVSITIGGGVVQAVGDNVADGVHQLADTFRSDVLEGKFALQVDDEKKRVKNVLK